MNKNLLSLDDNQLIEKFRAGITEAFSVFVYKYSETLRLSLHPLVNGDKHLVDDLEQETYIKAIVALRGKLLVFKGTTMKQWLNRIGYNLAMDHHRKVKRTPYQNGIDEDFCATKVVDTTPEERLVLKQHKNLFPVLLTQLPKEQQTTALFRLYYELGYKEIASLTNTPIDTQIGRMRYAIINLKKMTAVL